MYKKIILTIFAVMQLLCANLHQSYRVSVGGAELPGTFSREDVRRSGTVSCRAVDELARGDSAPEAYRLTRVWGFRAPNGDRKALCDALICSAPGTARYCAVYVGNKLCGVVADPAEFQNEAGYLPGVDLCPVYSFRGRPSDYPAVCAAVYTELDKFT
jgi:hypothetical protein